MKLSLNFTATNLSGRWYNTAKGICLCGTGVRKWFDVSRGLQKFTMIVTNRKHPEAHEIRYIANNLFSEYFSIEILNPTTGKWVSSTIGGYSSDKIGALLKHKFATAKHIYVRLEYS